MSSDLCLDARRDARVGQAREEGVGSTVAARHRKQVRESGGVGEVRIAIERDVHSTAPLASDAREHVVELFPVARPLRFQMRDLQRAPRAARDGDRFVDGFEQPVVFVAHVRRIRQTTRGERLAQRDQLVERSERTRRVLEAGRRAARALRERFLDHRGHARQLGGGGGTVVVADNDAAQAAESDHRRDVDRWMEFVDRREERGEGSLSGVVAGRGLALTRARRRARAAVLSHDDRRDPLSDERLGARILVERAVAVRVDVDEPRRNGQPARVDLVGAALGDASRDRDDLVRR